MKEIFNDVQTLGHVLALRAVYVMELFTNVKELAMLNLTNADVAVKAMRDLFERLQAVDAVIGTGKAEWTALWSKAYQFASPCSARMRRCLVSVLRAFGHIRYA